jgi:hypothetical protein
MLRASSTRACSELRTPRRAALVSPDEFRPSGQQSRQPPISVDGSGQSESGGAYAKGRRSGSSKQKRLG